LPLKDKEKLREYNKKYNQAHREQRRENSKKYRETHREQRKEYRRKYYQAHREHCIEAHKKWSQTHREQRRDYHRTHVLGTTHANGNKVHVSGLNKRPYTNYCEICGILKIEKLHYHHWNKEKLSLGIWVCFKCHGLVEAIDRHGDNLQKMIDRYLKLKETRDMVLMPAR